MDNTYLVSVCMPQLRHRTGLHVFRERADAIRCYEACKEACRVLNDGWVELTWLDAQEEKNSNFAGGELPFLMLAFSGKTKEEVSR